MTMMIVVSFTSCEQIDDLLSAPSSGSSGGKYDGVYDFSIVTTSPSGNVTKVMPSGFFIIRNGKISSSDNTISGSVKDNFGTVEFTGPCPINGNGAKYTGLLSALATPKAGHGEYVCNFGGITRTWRVYNGK